MTDPDVVRVTDILKERFDLAAQYLLPAPLEWTLDLRFADTVKFLTDAWYCGDSFGVKDLDTFRVRNWGVESPPPFRSRPRVYLTMPMNDDHRMWVLSQEVADLWARTSKTSLPYTFKNIQERLEFDTEGVYPCLVRYTGTETRVRKLLQDHLPETGLFEVRAPAVWATVSGVFQRLSDAVPLFCERAAFLRAGRKLRRFLCMWDAKTYHSELTDTDRGATMYSVLLPVEQQAIPTPAEVLEQLRETLVAILCSALIKRRITNEGQDASLVLFHAKQLRFPGPGNHQQQFQDTVQVLYQSFLTNMFRSGWLFYNDSAVDIDGVARAYVQQCPVDDLDLDTVWQLVQVRYEAAVNVWKSTLGLICGTAHETWLKRVDHKRVKNVITPQLTKVTAAISTTLDSIKRPSFGEATPSVTQLAWRRSQSTLVWWHQSAYRARMCGCDTNVRHFAACMLQHLTQYTATEKLFEE